MRLRIPLVVVGLVTSLVLSACSTSSPAATVGRDRITDDQLAREVPVFRFLSALNRQPCGQAQAGETEQSACARFTLTTLIQEDLVKGYARDHHITVSDAQVASTISQLETSVGSSLGPQLSAQGLTKADLTGIVRRILLFNEVEKAVAESSISNAQIQSLYQEQRASLTQIHAKHILVKTRAAAERIEKQVTTKNFGRLAKRYSTDTGSAAKGGDLGTIPATSLDPTFVSAAESLKPGQISQPVKTQFGWHIIELVSVTVPPLAQVRDQLVGSLQGNAFGSWLRERLATLGVTVNPRYGRFDPATGGVVPVRSTATTPPSQATPESPSP
jgi:foldase protein PrsA